MATSAPASAQAQPEAKMSSRHQPQQQAAHGVPQSLMTAGVTHRGGRLQLAVTAHPSSSSLQADRRRRAAEAAEGHQQQLQAAALLVGSTQVQTRPPALTPPLPSPQRPPSMTRPPPAATAAAHTSSTGVPVAADQMLATAGEGSSTTSVTIHAQMSVTPSSDTPATAAAAAAAEAAAFRSEAEVDFMRKRRPDRMLRHANDRLGHATFRQWLACRTDDLAKRLTADPTSHARQRTLEKRAYEKDYHPTYLRLLQLIDDYQCLFDRSATGEASLHHPPPGESPSLRVDALVLGAKWDLWQLQPPWAHVMVKPHFVATVTQAFAEHLCDRIASTPQIIVFAGRFNSVLHTSLARRSERHYHAFACNPSLQSMAHLADRPRDVREFLRNQIRHMDVYYRDLSDEALLALIRSESAAAPQQAALPTASLAAAPQLTAAGPALQQQRRGEQLVSTAAPSSSLAGSKRVHAEAIPKAASVSVNSTPVAAAVTYQLEPQREHHTSKKSRVKSPANAIAVASASTSRLAFPVDRATSAPAAVPAEDESMLSGHGHVKDEVMSDTSHSIAVVVASAVAAQQQPMLTELDVMASAAESAAMDESIDTPLLIVPLDVEPAPSVDAIPVSAEVDAAESFPPLVDDDEPRPKSPTESQSTYDYEHSGGETTDNKDSSDEEKEDHFFLNQLAMSQRRGGDQIGLAPAALVPAEASPLNLVQSQSSSATILLPSPPSLISLAVQAEVMEPASNIVHHQPLASSVVGPAQSYLPACIQILECISEHSPIHGDPDRLDQLSNNLGEMKQLIMNMSRHFLAPRVRESLPWARSLRGWLHRFFTQCTTLMEVQSLLPLSDMQEFTRMRGFMATWKVQVDQELQPFSAGSQSSNSDAD